MTIDLPRKEITGEVAKLAASACDAYQLWQDARKKAAQWELYYKDMARLLENGLADPCEATIGGVPVARYVEYSKKKLNQTHLKEAHPMAYLDSIEQVTERRLTMIVPEVTQ